MWACSALCSRGSALAAGPLGGRARLPAAGQCDLLDFHNSWRSAAPRRRGRGTRPRLTRARLRRPLCRPGRRAPPRPAPSSLAAAAAAAASRNIVCGAGQCPLGVGVRGQNGSAPLPCTAVPLAGEEMLLPEPRAAPHRTARTPPDTCMQASSYGQSFAAPVENGHVYFYGSRISTGWSAASGAGARRARGRLAPRRRPRGKVPHPTHRICRHKIEKYSSFFKDLCHHNFSTCFGLPGESTAHSYNSCKKN